MRRYLLTSKYFKYGLILTLAGALGIALFGVFRIFAFAYYGPITLPYTTPIDDLSAILFFGSLPVSELIALHKWQAMKERQAVETEPIAEEITPAPIAIPAIANLVFVDHEAALMLGDVVAKLPPTKNEHCLCRTMFKHRVNEYVDWSLPYEEMVGADINEGYDLSRQEKARRMVYDTTKALNARAKQHLGIDDLFVWQGKTIKRTR